MGEFEIYRDDGGEYRWRLQADDNRIIAGSAEGYFSKSDCEHGIDLVKQLAPSAPINDLTLQVLP